MLSESSFQSKVMRDKTAYVVFSGGVCTSSLSIDPNLISGFSPVSFATPIVSSCNNYELYFEGSNINSEDLAEEFGLRSDQTEKRSAGEIILELLVSQGFGMLSKISGAFVFAFLEKEKGQLTLVRDRLGEKQLFYVKSDLGITLALTPLGIFNSGVSKVIDTVQLDELFFYGSVSGEHTLFQGVKNLLPGHYQMWSSEGTLVNKERWFELGREIKKIRTTQSGLSDWMNKLGDTVKSSGSTPFLLQFQESTSILSRTSHEILGNKNQRFFFLESGRISPVDKNSTIGNDFLSISEGRKYNQLFLELRSFFSEVQEPIFDLEYVTLWSLRKELVEIKPQWCTDFGMDSLFSLDGNFEESKNLKHLILKTILKHIPLNRLKDSELIRLKKSTAFQNPDFQVLTHRNSLFISDLRQLGLRSLNLIPEYRIGVLEESKKLFPGNILRQQAYVDFHTHFASQKKAIDSIEKNSSLGFRLPLGEFAIVLETFAMDNSTWNALRKGNDAPVSSKEYLDRISTKKKLDLRLKKIILTHPDFRGHLESMHSCPLFKLSWLNFIDVKKETEDFKSDSRSNFDLIRFLFFSSLWYQSQFES